MSTRHFLTLLDLTPSELQHVISEAIRLKAEHKKGVISEPLKNKVLGMIFEKSSTRTRVSFEAGMVQLGGGSIFLSPRDTQLGRGEPIEDSSRVLSSMVDQVMIRTFEHEKIELFAQYSFPIKHVVYFSIGFDKIYKIQLLLHIKIKLAYKMHNLHTFNEINDRNLYQ